ncbi:MAG: urea transporter [Muribaculaceae bacterium]|nr:urea transporter [Muribaculaceae bacterium]
MAAIYTTKQVVREFPRTFFRGIGQVFFQDSPWTGILIFIGIFWGAYAGHTPAVAWGMVVGTFVSTLTGYLLQLPDKNGANGLWGFNGCLVGCAFPTFMGDTVWMWFALVLCSAFSTWVRTGLDNVMDKWNVSSLTFPFVLSTYFFLLASRLFQGMPPEFMGSPELPHADGGVLNVEFGNLVEYWLKGISQVFLINNWVTGICFIVALAINNIRAAVWGMIGSALSLAVVIMWKGPATDISSGLYGFSAVLTGIALGATFCNKSWQTVVWAVIGIVVTVFIQAAMNAYFSPIGLPTLTGPFCVATWLFLFPKIEMFQPKPVQPAPTDKK